MGYGGLILSGLFVRDKKKRFRIYTEALKYLEPFGLIIF